MCCTDLHTLHGLQPVIQHLSQQSAQVQAAAAYVLGTAASNNNKFQEQLMGLYPDSIKLLLMVSNKPHLWLPASMSVSEEMQQSVHMRFLHCAETMAFTGVHKMTLCAA